VRRCDGVATHSVDRSSASVSMERSRSAVALVASLVAAMILCGALVVAAANAARPLRRTRAPFVGFATSQRDPFATTTAQLTTSEPSLLARLLELVGPETEKPGVAPVNRTAGDAGIVESALQLEAG
jgi:hypothetical protein